METQMAGGRPGSREKGTSTEVGSSREEKGRDQAQTDMVKPRNTTARFLDREHYRFADGGNTLLRRGEEGGTQNSRTLQ